MKVIPVTYLMKVIPVTYLMKVIPVTYLMKVIPDGTTHIDHGSNLPIIAIYIVCMVMKFANEYILF
jgi:hypothetical protein